MSTPRRIAALCFLALISVDGVEGTTPAPMPMPGMHGGGTPHTTDVPGGMSHMHGPATTDAPHGAGGHHGAATDAPHGHGGMHGPATGGPMHGGGGMPHAHATDAPAGGHMGHHGHSSPTGHAGHSAGGHAMIFHASTDVTILFDGWNTAGSRGYYAISLIFVALLCAVGPVLRLGLALAKPLPLAARGAIAFVYFNITFAAMLIVMTFNVGVWWACMAGLTLGFGVAEMLEERRAAHKEEAKPSTDPTQQVVCAKTTTPSTV